MLRQSTPSLRASLILFSKCSDCFPLWQLRSAFGVRRSAFGAQQRERFTCPRSQPARLWLDKVFNSELVPEPWNRLWMLVNCGRNTRCRDSTVRIFRPDPFEQFRLWFEESVRTAGDREPNAMTLATASRAGVPSARVVLLKSFDERGVMFFTNYESRKAQQLAENPHAALNFHWPWLERQIQMEGVVQKVGREESKAYFDKRPIGSRLGAIVSKQSSVIESREKLEERLLALEGSSIKRTNPPIPEFWGGYLLVPERFEFWQGRENRLHDRFLYTPGVDASWQIDRLAP